MSRSIVVYVYFVVLICNQSVSSRRNAPFVKSVDSNDNNTEIVIPETRRRHQAHRAHTPDDNLFETMRRKTSHNRSPSEFREGFNLHADKYNYPPSRHTDDRDYYITRKQREFRKSELLRNQEMNRNSDDDSLSQDVFKNTPVDIRFRVSEENNSERDSLSDPEFRSRDIKVPKEINNFGSNKHERRDKQKTSLLDEMDESLSFEKHNSKFLHKMNQKVKESQRQKDLLKRDKHHKRISSHGYNKPDAVLPEMDNENTKHYEKRKGTHEKKMKKDSSPETLSIPKYNKPVESLKLGLSSNERPNLYNKHKRPKQPEDSLEPEIRMSEAPPKYKYVNPTINRELILTDTDTLGSQNDFEPIRPSAHPPRKEFSYKKDMFNVNRKNTDDSAKNVGRLMPAERTNEAMFNSHHTQHKPQLHFPTVEKQKSTTRHKYTYGIVETEKPKENSPIPDRHGQHEDKDDAEPTGDFSRAEIHFSSVDEFENTHEEKQEFSPMKDVLRSNVESRKSWQRCLGKKSLKACRRACTTAYQNVCRRLRCTSKSKKDLKKQCGKSCKDAFKYSKYSAEKGKKEKRKSDKSDSDSDSGDSSD